MPDNADGWRVIRGLAAALARRYWRATTATLVALAGLGLIALGPAWAAVGAQELSDWRAGQFADQQHRRLGTEVHDGPVTFLLHTVECGRPGRDQRSQGQVCTVTVAARNDGAAPVTVPGQLQKLYVTTGAWHLPAAAPEAPFGTLDPGEAATATIGYDLPPYATADRIEVYAGPHSRGQAIALGGPPLPLSHPPSI